jgi:hypothetical protein
LANHFNADFAVNDDGSPGTAQLLNPVPCILDTDMNKKLMMKFWRMLPYASDYSWDGSSTRIDLGDIVSSV